jgi:hypothetical protein
VPTYYNLQSYLTDAGGVPLVIDISNKSGNYLYVNQPTGDDSQWWTMIPDGSSGYYFIQSKWKNSDGKNVVIDIHGASTNMPIPNGTLLDAYPQKSKDYDNQLWKPVAELTSPGYSFYQSKLTDEAGNPVVIDIQGGVNALKTPIDAWPQKSSNYQNQLWTLAG